MKSLVAALACLAGCGGLAIQAEALKARHSLPHARPDARGIAFQPWGTRWYGHRIWTSWPRKARYSAGHTRLCPSCIPARHAAAHRTVPRHNRRGWLCRQAHHRPDHAQSCWPTRLHDDSGWPMDAQTPTNEPYRLPKRKSAARPTLTTDEYDSSSRQAAPETGGIRELVAKLGLSYNGWKAKPWPLAEELHPNFWIVSQSRKTLKEAPAEQPLFLTASFFLPAPRRSSLRSGTSTPTWRKSCLPRPMAIGWIGKPYHPKAMKSGIACCWRATRSHDPGRLFRPHPAIGRPGCAAHRRVSRSVAVRRNGPWVILLSADHGEMLGDHGFLPQMRAV